LEGADKTNDKGEEFWGWEDLPMVEDLVLTEKYYFK